MRSWLLRLGTLLAAIPLMTTLGGCGCDGPAKPQIGAAASLRRVLPALLEAYGKRANGKEGHRDDGFHVSYAGSGAVRQQVEAGAAIDLAILAGDRHIDRLIGKGLATPDSRTEVATNTLVLIGPTGGPPLTFKTLPSLPDEARLAIGNPDAVPAGRYAREALQSLGSWRDLKARCIYTQDVVGVLTFVRRGEVRAGIAYRTEVQAIDGIEELDRAAGDWAPRPIVVGAIIADTPYGAQARAFLAFLTTAKARSIFEQFGFGAP